MMKCPYCNQNKTKVLESRMCESDRVMRRRRECTNCSKRFTTYERMELEGLYIIKKDKRREEFSRAKLIKGIIKACKKRPVSSEKIEKTTDEIEGQIRSQGKTEIKSRYLGKIVMDKLRQLDEVAYIRFTSVYKKFRDINQFTEEIETLKKGGQSQND